MCNTVSRELVGRCRALGRLDVRQGVRHSVSNSGGARYSNGRPKYVSTHRASRYTLKSD